MAEKSVGQGQVAGIQRSDFVKEAKKFREIDTTSRVYVKEWLQVFFAVATSEGMDSCVKVFESKYSGRVHEDDHRISERFGLYRLELQLWNVKAEFRDEEYAVKWAESMFQEGAFEVVTRNSRREHTLRDYGVKKLIQS